MLRNGSTAPNLARPEDEITKDKSADSVKQPGSKMKIGWNQMERQFVGSAKWHVEDIITKCGKAKGVAEHENRILKFRL